MYALPAFAAGAVAAAAVFVYVMRNFMIKTVRIEATFEDVCRRLGDAVTSVPGWGLPLPDWDFYSVVSSKHAFSNVVKKRLFFVCKSLYANRIVDRHPWMGAMMPCTWAVYETGNGDVFISKMNIGLMSKMFMGSIIGSTMTKVAEEEHRILTALNRLLEAPAEEAVKPKTEERPGAAA
ncbi:MAG TPA: DUF302 domain-containing protein [bacterium]|nr:DUF302 domain-containing protein [bacterium]HPQ65219.1 DUF302 domain-containing protein [bacterium]